MMLGLSSYQRLEAEIEAGELPVHDSCILKVKTYPARREGIEYYVVSTTNHYNLLVSIRLLRRDVFGFDTVKILTTGDSVLMEFYSLDWTWVEDFTVTGYDTFKVRLLPAVDSGAVSYQICLEEKEPVPDIVQVNQDGYCVGDTVLIEYWRKSVHYYLKVFDSNGNWIPLSVSLSSGSLHGYVGFPLPSFSTGQYVFTFCLYDQNGEDIYCEDWPVTIIDTPDVEIVGGDTTLCCGQYCFEFTVVDAYNLGGLVEQYLNGVWEVVSSSLNGTEICANFGDTGLYRVIVWGSNPCGEDWDTIDVYVKFPGAAFTWSGACARDSVRFYDESICSDFWFWDFGDGATSMEENPVHMFPGPGTYQVTLVIDNQGTSVTQQVKVYLPEVSPIYGPQSACDSQAVYGVSLTDEIAYVSWAVDTPGGWVMTYPMNEFRPTWVGGVGGWVYVMVTDVKGCWNYDSIPVFNCCMPPVNDSNHLFFYNDTITNNRLYHGKRLYVNGTVLITDNSTVRIEKSQVYLAPDTRIEVNSNAQLLLRDDTFSSCDTLMWDGIHVTNVNAYLSVAYCSIRDAKYAIFSQDGGNFLINKSNFDRNYVHLRVENYTGEHQGSITNSRLTCNGQLMPQYPWVRAGRTDKAIWIKFVRSITIGSGVSNSQNIIENCDVGIYAFNSFVRVINNRFQNIEPSTQFGRTGGPTGYGIYSISPLGFNYVGLSTVGNTSWGGGNEFRNVANGIYMFNNARVVVKNNRFWYTNTSTSSRNAITLFEYIHPAFEKVIENNRIENYNRGIVLVNGERVSVRFNKIYNVRGFQTPVMALKGYGVRSEGGVHLHISNNEIDNSGMPQNTAVEGISISQGTDALIECNELMRMGIAIRIQGSNPGLELKKNTMRQSLYGIVLSDNGWVPQQGEVVNNQGYSWRNRWYGHTFLAHLYTMNHTDGSVINFFLHSSDTANYNDFLNLSDNGLYSPFKLVSAMGMIFPGCLSGFTPVNRSWMEEVAGGVFGGGNWRVYERWMVEHRLYRVLKDEPQLIQGSVLGDFMREKRMRSQGLVKDIRDTLREGWVEEALSMNRLMGFETYPDSVEKVMMEWYLVHIRNEEDFQWRVEYQDDSIARIAGLCPFVYGDGVYVARELMRMRGDTTNYMNECEEELWIYPNRMGEFVTEDTMEVKMYLIGANRLVIETDMMLPGRCRVFSLPGQLLYEEVLIDSRSLIDLEGIKPQPVMVEISNGGGVLSRKLMVISGQ